MHQKISYTPQAQTLLSRNPEFRSDFYHLISLIFEFNGNQSIDIKVSAYTDDGVSYILCWIQKINILEIRYIQKNGIQSLTQH